MRPVLMTPKRYGDSSQRVGKQLLHQPHQRHRRNRADRHDGTIVQCARPCPAKRQPLPDRFAPPIRRASLDRRRVRPPGRLRLLSRGHPNKVVDIDLVLQAHAEPLLMAPDDSRREPPGTTPQFNIRPTLRRSMCLDQKSSGRRVKDAHVGPLPVTPHARRDEYLSSRLAWLHCFKSLKLGRPTSMTDAGRNLRECGVT